MDLARDLVKWARTVEKFVFKAAILEGVVYEGKAGVTQLSKMPTREEAQSNVVTLVLSPGRNLLGAVKGPGGRVRGVFYPSQKTSESGSPAAPAKPAERH